MSKWGKGSVFADTTLQAQQTLYLPPCWLKKGINTISIFEQINFTEQKKIKRIKTPVLDQLRK
jgi:beta-galactosidase